MMVFWAKMKHKIIDAWWNNLVKYVSNLYDRVKVTEMSFLEGNWILDLFESAFRCYRPYIYVKILIIYELSEWIH